jgi:integrase
MSKRGNREGCIFELPDGRWRGAVSLGIDDHNRPIRKWVQRQTRGEVVTAINALVARKKDNLPITSARRTVEMYLNDWLKDEVAPNRNVSTHRIYEQMCRLHIIPVLGRIRLDQLNGQHVQRAVNLAAESLSPSSVKLVATILRTALRCGERWGVVAGNAAKHTSLPTAVKYDAKPLTAEQAIHLLETVKDHRYGALWVVALSMGLRHNEVAGLRWENIDFATGWLNVRTQIKRVPGKGVLLVELKTKAAKRSLRMPQFVINALLRRQLMQEAEHVKAGEMWKNPDGFVFTSRHGDVIAPEKVTVIHTKMLQRAKLSHVRFHDLRHSCATLLISKGVTLKMLQEILGHSDFQTTANIYAHVAEAMRDEATQAMNSIFDSPKNPVVAPVVAFEKSTTIN